MSEITLFLLTLIGVLVPANVLLWFTGKNRDKNVNKGTATVFLENPKAINLQSDEIQVMQENIYSRISALEEAVIQLQNELNETKALKSIEQKQKKEKLPKNNRVKILEEYLKKT